MIRRRLSRRYLRETVGNRSAVALRNRADGDVPTPRHTDSDLLVELNDAVLSDIHVMASSTARTRSLPGSIPL